MGLLGFWDKLIIHFLAASHKTPNSQFIEFMFLYSRRCIQGNVVDVARAAGNFKTLLKILSELEVPSEDPRLKPMTLLDILKMQREVTVFAPTDEAFAKVEGHLNPRLFNLKLQLPTFQPKASTPDLSIPDFSIMIFLTPDFSTMNF